VSSPSVLFRDSRHVRFVHGLIRGDTGVLDDLRPQRNMVLDDGAGLLERRALGLAARGVETLLDVGVCQRRPLCACASVWLAEKRVDVISLLATSGTICG
jgi:hypothetical protein